MNKFTLSTLYRYGIKTLERMSISVSLFLFRTQIELAFLMFRYFVFEQWQS